MPETITQEKIVISFDAFNNLKKLKDELDALTEMIEILNDEKLTDASFEYGCRFAWP